MALQLACESFLQPNELICDCELGSYTEEEVIEAASDMLVRVSGGAFRGRCTVTLLPIYDPCFEPESMYLCRADRDVITLPYVNPTVTAVKIDGVLLPVDQWAVVNGNQLVRRSTGDRPPPWPRDNDTWKPDSEVGTFSVTLTHGYAVDFLVKRAVLEVACELTKGLKIGGALDGFTTQATLDGLTVSRDAGEAEEAGFSWLARFMRLYDGSNGAVVWSPELAGGWSFITVG